MPAKAQEYPGAVARAVREMRLAGIEGPFSLVLGVDAWAALMQSASGCYPPYRTIERLLGGALHMTSAIHGGLVLSTAKGYFELTVGQDFAVGYGGHDHEHAEVNFYLTESFTFRVLEPKAAVRLDPAPGGG